MTAAVARHSDTNIFSMFSSEREGLYRARREAFALAMLGQAALLGLAVYLTGYVIQHPPGAGGELPIHIRNLPLVFSRPGGGGGGGLDPLPASHGAVPKSSLDFQLAPPQVIVLNPNPRLTVTPTIVAPPDLRVDARSYGDPLAAISNAPSNGRGGPGGVGDHGCCGGDGPGNGPGGGPGPFKAGYGGVSVPVVIFNPEPVFSEEARKAKAQGIVVLLVVVDTDGHTRDLRVQSSLGMGLDEKAMEAVSKWRFHPAMFNGKPVPAQIAVEVNFHLY